MKNVNTINFNCFNGVKIKELVFNHILVEPVQENDDYSMENVERDEAIEYLKRIDSIEYVEKVTIPSDFVAISFKRINNPYLKEVHFSDTPNYYVDNNVIYSKDKLRLIGYPGGLDATEFTIPEHAIEIESDAFRGTEKLEKIIAHKDVKLTDGMFSFCTSIKSIEFKHEKITTFPNHCFAFCKKLITIKLSDASLVTSLGKYCFYGCESLQELTFNNELYFVDCGCFMNCLSLTNIDLTRVSAIYKQCFKSTADKLYVQLSTPLKIIDDEAFMDSGIKEFHCQDNLEIINKMAFCNCFSLKTFEFNENIKSIGFKTFSNTAITELFIPNSLMFIDLACFVGSEIDFKFSSEGHPLFYVENDCFMNIAKGLMFVTKNTDKYFEIPSTVKLIVDESFQNRNIYKVVVDPLKFGVDIKNYIQNSRIFCDKDDIYQDCRNIVSDVNNPDRYNKEGEYDPTYKIDNNIFDVKSDWPYVSELVTGLNDHNLFFQNKSLPFVDNFDNFGNLHAALIAIIAIVSTLITILSIVILNMSK